MHSLRPNSHLRWPACGAGLRHDSHQRGFTLVELLVVFALLALIMGVVPLAFDRMSASAQYRSTLRHMVADMRQARQLAVAQGVETRFVINLSARTYGVSGRTPRALPPSLTVRTTVAEIETDGEQLAAIRFMASGGSTGGSVEVARPSGDGTRLQVDWLSGRLSIESLLP